MPLIPTLPVKPGYRPQAEDTSIEADVFYFAALRQKSQLWRTERFICFNGLYVGISLLFSGVSLLAAALAVRKTVTTTT
jgi:hypothetical protein